MNISKLLKKYNLSRSPYIFYDDSMPAMYFTVYENNEWQLYFTDNKEVQKVDFLQGYSINQVTCFKKQDLYCVSFCSKMGESNSLFYAETDNPAQFKVITTIAHNCKAGTITPNKVLVFNKQNHLLIYNNTQDLINKNDLLTETPERDLFFNFKDPTQITFMTNDQNQVIISYEDVQPTERQGSIWVNLNDLGDQKQILTEDNKPLYDVTIDPYTHQILYSKHVGLRKFQRKIAKTYLKNINSNPVNILQEK